MPATEVYGKYHLVTRIAVGGMAEVLLGRSSSVGGFEKYLAIKRMHPRLSAHRGFVSLFIEEAKLSVSLTHPNIVQIFDFGRVDDNYFIAMEYVDGVDLATLGARARDIGHPMPVEATVHIVRQVFEGMGYAHTKRDLQGRPAGIVHRDISPHNVLVSTEGQVKISDFGIAKAVEEIQRSDKGEVVGKVSYMAPEQARGEPVGPASDVWSAGVVLHELLTNQRLFTRPTDPEALEAVQQLPIIAPSRFNPLVPPALDDIVLRILDRALARRPHDARLVAEQLDDVARHCLPRMNDFRLSELIRAMYGGRPPGLLAALDASAEIPAPTPTPIQSWDHTVPGASEPAEPTRGARPREREPLTGTRGTPPLRAKSSLSHMDPAVRAPVADESWALDPFASEPSLPSSVPPAPLLEEVERLKAVFAAEPNLWTLVEIGDAYARAGHPDRRDTAYELAAAKFAQRGLLVQAVAILDSLRLRDGVAVDVGVALRRLPGLRGLSDEALLLELLDAELGGHDFTEYRGLLELHPDLGSRPEPPDAAPIFSALDGSQLERLAEHLELHPASDGERVIAEGDPGDSLYWVGRGRMVVSVHHSDGRRVYVTSLGEGDCFGEQSFFSGKPRDASVESVGDALVMEVGKAAIDSLVEEFPQIVETLRQFYRDRVAESLLARSPLFGTMGIRDRRQLAASFQFVGYDEGEVVLHEGERSDAFYAVKSGQVLVYTGPDDEPIELARLGAGEVFGEIAALKGIERTASVRALESCELLRLEAIDLVAYLDRSPQIRDRIEAQILSRAEETARRVSGAVGELED